MKNKTLVKAMKIHLQTKDKEKEEATIISSDRKFNKL